MCLFTIRDRFESERDKGGEFEFCLADFVLENLACGNVLRVDFAAGGANRARNEVAPREERTETKRLTDGRREDGGHSGQDRNNA